MTTLTVPLNSPTPTTKLILLSMVKNESRIIERLMSSVVGRVDGIVICDTGSTDTTVELARKFLRDRSIPGKVFTYPFKNFGVSRTQSFHCCQEWVKEMGWDSANTWALLLDGDMMLSDAVPYKTFSTLRPSVAGITLKQANGGLVYSNMRLLRCSEPWICKGGTHEAWTCPPSRDTTALDSPILTDHADGGCKHDKYERDIRLLTEDLSGNPNDARTLFYLGQTYLGMRDWTRAIPILQRRIEVGGWDEEVYIAQIYLGECYENAGHDADAVRTWLDAWQRRQHRTEAPMRLISFYRKKPKSQFLASLFLEKLFALQTGRSFATGDSLGPPTENNDILFVNVRDKEYNFWEEMAILGFYTGLQRPTWLHLDQLDLTTKLNWHDFNNLFGQVHWYDWVLKPRRQTRFTIPLEHLPWSGEDQAGCWEPFNPSIRAKSDGSGFLVNLRYANYFTKEAKVYDYRGFHGQVLTRNCLLDISGTSHPDWNRPISVQELKISSEFKQDESHYIRGVEDCRLVAGSSELEWMGTSQSYSDNRTNKIFHIWQEDGKDGFSLKQLPLPPGVSPMETQKNWMPFRRDGKLLHIYSFSPFKVCNAATGVPILSIDTTDKGRPYSLKEYRGSAGPTAWDSAAFPEEAWICVMHKVYIGGDGRRYYHRFMTLDKNLCPSRVSCWVRMTKERVEYWSGMTRVGAGGPDSSYWITYGVQDSQAYVAELAGADIEALLFYDLKKGEAVSFRDRLAAIPSSS